MYRLLLFISFTILVGVSFYSCDGRYKQKDSQKIAVEKFIRATHNLEAVSLIPEYPAAIVTDTIISSQIKVHIKTNTIDNEVLKIRSQTNQAITAYRKNESYIEITNNDHLVFSKNIDIEMFITTDVFWNSAILESVWVNEFESNNQEVYLDIVYKNPVTNSYRFFEMLVQKDGNYTIKPV